MNQESPNFLAECAGSKFTIRQTETIPVILLQGEWIRKLGFNVKDHVIVSEKKGQIIINLETE